jgi:membrane protein DedA with SNARE-associated domain
MLNWITDLMASAGYLGILGLMFGENVFPPIPSEVVMPLAGYLAATGELMFLGVLIAGTVGSVLGALLWYYIGYWIGEERLKTFAADHGRWLTLRPKDVDKAHAWFDKHGWKAVFFGRMIPGVRTLISVPAGITCMPLLPFLLYTTAGSLVWSGFLALAGYLLQSQYEQVSSWLSPVSTAIVVLAVLWYVYRVIKGTGVSTAR